MRVSKNFIIQEFVTPNIYRRWGNSSIWFVDKRVIDIAQWLKDYTGAIVILNDWYWGGDYENSGTREAFSLIGVEFSQHKFGRAGDPKIEGFPAQEVREIIRNNFKQLNQLGLTTIEKATPTWTHYDVRFTGSDKLLEVNG